MKSIKKILSLLLVLSLMAAMALAMVSCDDNDGGKNDGENNDGDNQGSSKATYTVTVKDENGAGIPGVKVLISDDVSLFKTLTADSNGKVSLELNEAKDGLGFEILEAPSEYEIPESTRADGFHALFGDKKDVEFTLSSPTVETVTFTVTVVDQNGDAVEGVEIQICHTVCVQCPLTNSEGKSVKELPADKAAGTLKVGVLHVPDGYTIPTATVDGGYHAVINPGETAVTVEIIKN